jgi:hypothetical protein
MATLPYERDILNTVFCHHLSEVEKLALFFTENSSPLISKDNLVSLSLNNASTHIA